MKLLLLTFVSLCFLFSISVYSQESDQKAPAVFEGKLIKKPIKLEEHNKENPSFKKGAKFTFTYLNSEDTKPTKELIEFLDKLNEWMRNNPQSEIRVTGHADQSGSHEEMQDRSMKRAKEVQTYIVGKAGINKRRILVTGEGARNPIADVYSEMGKAQNRRVEIVIIIG